MVVFECGASQKRSFLLRTGAARRLWSLRGGGKRAELVRQVELG